MNNVQVHQLISKKIAIMKFIVCYLFEINDKKLF